VTNTEIENDQWLTDVLSGKYGKPQQLGMRMAMAKAAFDSIIREASHIADEISQYEYEVFPSTIESLTEILRHATAGRASLEKDE
jgi:hypothetical protein